MTYPKKLLIAKLIITLCWVAMVVPPFAFTFITGAGEGVPVDAIKSQFLVTWLLIAHGLYLPVLLYLLWGKLHGTGRSVRAVAFLGMGYASAFFVAFSIRSGLKPETLSISEFDMSLDQSSHMMLCGCVFCLFLLAVILSVKPGGN